MTERDESLYCNFQVFLYETMEREKTLKKDAQKKRILKEAII